MFWKKKDNEYFKLGLALSVAICVGILFYYIIFNGEHFLGNLSLVANICMPVIYGLAFAYLLTPVCNFFEYHFLNYVCKLLKIKPSKRRASALRGISILFTLVLIFGLIYMLIHMIISEVVPSIQNIIDNSDQYMNNASKWINTTLDDYPDVRETAITYFNKYYLEIEKWIEDTLLQKSTDILKTVSLSVISVLKVLYNFIMGFIISVYVLAGKEKFTGEAKRILYTMMNEKTANVVLNNFKFTHRTFGGFISGKVLDSLIIGILCFIGTSILGTPYALLVSVLIGVTNIIPFFGPFLGAIPSSILILLVDPTKPQNLIVFIIFILILQQIDGNLIGPKILGGSIGLTGFWVIFSLTVFGGLFGIVGILIGVPLFAVVYAALKSIIETKLKKKHLPIHSDDYIDINAIVDGQPSIFTPEYKLSRKELKNFKESEENLMKSYGKKFVSEFNRETMVNQQPVNPDHNEDAVDTED